MTIYVSAHQVEAVNAGTLRQLADALADLADRDRELRTFMVTGSRGWFDWQTMWASLALIPRDATMFNGMAEGADTLARSFWWAQGGEVRPFHAKWNLGNHAGLTRNAIMLEHMPQLVLAYLRHDLPSPGTRHAWNQATQRGIRVFGFHQFESAERSAVTDPKDHDRRRGRDVSR